MIHSNSASAFSEERETGRMSKRAAAILRWLNARPRPFTDREVMTGMGFQDPNQVRPRITELIHMGILEEVDSVKCPVTGKTVRRIAPILNQAELPL